LTFCNTATAIVKSGIPGLPGVTSGTSIKRKTAQKPNLYAGEVLIFRQLEALKVSDFPTVAALLADIQGPVQYQELFNGPIYQVVWAQDHISA